MGAVARGAVAMRSRSCGSGEVLGSWVVVVAIRLCVGVLLVLLTGFETGWRRCAIGLAEPALRQVGPALGTRPWRCRHGATYGGIED